MTERRPLTDLQALVTGAIIGALLRAPEHGLNITADALTLDGSYTGQIKVTGRESGETVLVAVMADAADIINGLVWTAPGLKVVPEPE